MNWFWWFIAAMFGLRVLVALWFSTNKGPLPKWWTAPPNVAYGVLVNGLFLLGVLYYGGAI